MGSVRIYQLDEEKRGLRSVTKALRYAFRFGVRIGPDDLFFGHTVCHQVQYQGDLHSHTPDTGPAIHHGRIHSNTVITLFSSRNVPDISPVKLPHLENMLPPSIAKKREFGIVRFPVITPADGKLIHSQTHRPWGHTNCMKFPLSIFSMVLPL